MLILVLLLKISFKIKDKLATTKDTHTVEICDTDFDGSLEVNLSSYVKFLSKSKIKTIYATLQDAQKETPVLLIIKVAGKKWRDLLF